MTNRMQKNLLNYALYAALSIGVGVLTALLTQLNGDGPINWRPVVAAAVSATLAVLTMALSSMNLTRIGSERIAAQVNALREDGVSRQDMVVLSESEAAEMMAGEIGLLSSEARQKLLAQLERHLPPSDAPR